MLLTVGASQIWICCSDFQRNCIASLTECPWGLWFSKAHGVQYPLFLTVHSAIAGWGQVQLSHWRVLLSAVRDECRFDSVHVYWQQVSTTVCLEHCTSIVGGTGHCLQMTSFTLEVHYRWAQTHKRRPISAHPLTAIYLAIQRADQHWHVLTITHTGARLDDGRSRATFCPRWSTDFNWWWCIADNECKHVVSNSR